MTHKHHSVEAVRDEVIAASEALRVVAQSEQDKPRIHVADWVDSQFIGIADRHSLRDAIRGALTLFQGGMGSFMDVNSTASSHAVMRLRAALSRGLDENVRDS